MARVQDINAAFTATGTSDECVARSGAINISGTFVGTVQIQRLIQGNWQVLAEYTAVTAAGDDVSFDNGVAMPMRYECTAYTSGTISADLVPNREST